MIDTTMICLEAECKTLSCALCFHCEKSLCLNHIIRHHENLINRQWKFYDQLQQFYLQLHSMSIEQCFRQVVEQISTENHMSIDFISNLRTIREDLVEQLNRFKQKQFESLKDISQRLASTEQWLDDQQAKRIEATFDEIQTSIQSLVYGIQIEISKTIQLRKIFYTKNRSLTLTKSSSWTDDSMKKKDQMLF